MTPGGVRNFILYDERNNEIGWGMGSAGVVAPGEKEARKGAAASREGTKGLAAEGFSRLGFPKRTDASREFRVRCSDMDIYQHVGSIRYIAWALATLPAAITAGWECRSLELQLRGGVASGERISAVAEIRERSGRIETVHSLHRPDLETAALVSATWRPAAGVRAQAGGGAASAGGAPEKTVPGPARHGEAGTGAVAVMR